MTEYGSEETDGYIGERNEEGQRHGKGMQTFEDGSKYIGIWKNDEYDHHGKLTLEDGTIYEG